MQIKLKIKLGPNPKRLVVFEREGELYELLGVRLFLCQPLYSSGNWRVFCAKTGLGIGNPYKSKDDAVESAMIKFQCYGREMILKLVEEGCKDGGFINEEALSTIKTLKIETKEKNLFDSPAGI